MHRHRFADDEAIGDKLADCLTRVGIADLADFVRVKPDLTLAAAGNRRGESFLGP